ncbi:hypothetical protein H2200_011082 [Cladophialophora chaetospira]|uniref:Cytochrome P450 n=1 Tax=Cladophialophora chaetospira TaxID=386627 RepID=A0AA38WZZ4_9EURO|nr:hypothetical protein H2200_011082 [Cladophialophora chaetospira]
MSRDPAVYKDPEKFAPERFYPEQEGGAAEPFLVGPFGFGRRICVGRHLAQASVWIFIATLIATVDVSKPLGHDGRRIEQPITLSTGLSSHPGKFNVVFKPRSSESEDLLVDTLSHAQ